MMKCNIQNGENHTMPQIVIPFVPIPIKKYHTTKGNSHEIPLPLVRAAIVVGPAKDGIQKKPSVKRPCNPTIKGNALSSTNDVKFDQVALSMPQVK
jgi:hypothetical protein